MYVFRGRTFSVIVESDDSGPLTERAWRPFGSLRPLTGPAVALGFRLVLAVDTESPAPLAKALSFGAFYPSSGGPRKLRADWRSTPDVGPPARPRQRRP